MQTKSRAFFRQERAKHICAVNEKNAKHTVFNVRPQKLQHV